MISYRSADILDRFKNRPLKVGDRVVVKPDHIFTINDFDEYKKVPGIIIHINKSESARVKYDQRLPHTYDGTMNFYLRSLMRVK